MLHAHTHVENFVVLTDALASRVYFAFLRLSPPPLSPWTPHRLTVLTPPHRSWSLSKTLDPSKGTSGRLSGRVPQATRKRSAERVTLGRDASMCRYTLLVAVVLVVIAGEEEEGGVVIRYVKELRVAVLLADEGNRRCFARNVR